MIIDSTASTIKILEPLAEEVRAVDILLQLEHLYRFGRTCTCTAKYYF